MYICDNVVLGIHSTVVKVVEPFRFPFSVHIPTVRVSQADLNLAFFRHLLPRS